MNRIILYANEGMYKTNGIIYGKEIILEEGLDGSDFYEITEEEYNALFENDEMVEVDNGFNQISEDDYQDALRDMGVAI